MKILSINHSWNTVLSALGYVVSLFEKYLGFSFRNGAPERAYNFLQLEPKLYTSGQPTQKQFQNMKGLGVESVVNLAPSSAENALIGEAQIVESLGMDYIHLPVDFKAPTEQNYQNFVEIMAKLESQTTWVHCAANMRVSAFLYRFRVEYQGFTTKKASIDLHKIWEPFGVWKTFLENEADTNDN